MCVWRGRHMPYVFRTEDNSVEPVFLFPFSHGSQELNSDLHSKHLYLLSQLTSPASCFKIFYGGPEAGVSRVAQAGL